MVQQAVWHMDCSRLVVVAVVAPLAQQQPRLVAPIDQFDSRQRALAVAFVVVVAAAAAYSLVRIDSVL